MRKQRVWKLTYLPALPFRNNSCRSDFLPSCLPFHMVYKYWQNLLASIEISLHLNSFLLHGFALWFPFPLLDFVIILCDSNYLMKRSEKNFKTTVFDYSKPEFYLKIKFKFFVSCATYSGVRAEWITLCPTLSKIEWKYVIRL